MPDFYSACDVLVLPSNNCLETFGRVLVEAMSCETPVIGSKIGGIPEVLGGEFRRFLFQAGSADELAGLLVRMKNLQREHSELRRQCREHVLQFFSLDATIDGVESVFLRSIEERRRYSMRAHGIILPRQ